MEPCPPARQAHRPVQGAQRGTWLMRHMHANTNMVVVLNEVCTVRFVPAAPANRHRALVQSKAVQPVCCNAVLLHQPARSSEDRLEHDKPPSRHTLGRLCF